MSGNLGFFSSLKGYSNSDKRFSEILSNKNIVSVTAGKHHSLAISNDHKVYGWGNANKGALPEFANVPYLL